MRGLAPEKKENDKAVVLGLSDLLAGLLASLLPAASHGATVETKLA